jgi:hypothetical protein
VSAAGRRELEHRAVVTICAALARGAIEVAVAALNDAGFRSRAVGAAGLAAERIKDTLHAGRRELEYRAGCIRAAAEGGSVEVAVAALDNIRSGGIKTVAAIWKAAHAAERVKGGQVPGRRELGHRAVVTIRAAAVGSAIEVAVAALDNAGLRTLAVGACSAPLAAKRVQHRLARLRERAMRVYEEQSNNKRCYTSTTAIAATPRFLRSHGFNRPMPPVGSIFIRSAPFTEPLRLPSRRWRVNRDTRQSHLRRLRDARVITAS